MNRLRLFSLLTALLVFVAQPLWGQVYSWKDSNGKVHYGDRPPVDRQATPRRLTAAPVVDADASRQALEQLKSADLKRQQAQDTARQQQEEQAQTQIRSQNCQRAQAQLKALESGRIRFAVDATGERLALDGERREAELARARQSAHEWCAPPPKAAAAPAPTPSSAARQEPAGNKPAAQ